jgi:Tfp pilus assembly PilM family ATPase
MSNTYFDTEDKSVVADLSGAIDEITGVSGGKSDDATKAQQISPIIQGVLSDMCSEVKRSLLYYESQLEGETVTKIILSGGTAKLINVASYFESFLDLKTEIINPLASISHRLKNSELMDMSPLIGVGIGLALRNVIT